MNIVAVVAVDASQNADDARATTVVIGLDEHAYHSAETCRCEATDSSGARVCRYGAYMQPSLLLSNDSVFSEKDYVSEQL